MNFCMGKSDARFGSCSEISVILYILGICTSLPPPTFNWGSFKNATKSQEQYIKYSHFPLTYKWYLSIVCFIPFKHLFNQRQTIVQLELSSPTILLCPATCLSHSPRHSRDLSVLMLTKLVHCPCPAVARMRSSETLRRHHGNASGDHFTERFSNIRSTENASVDQMTQ